MKYKLIAENTSVFEKIEKTLTDYVKSQDGTVLRNDKHYAHDQAGDIPIWDIYMDYNATIWISAQKDDASPNVGAELLVAPDKMSILVRNEFNRLLKKKRLPGFK